MNTKHLVRSFTLGLTLIGMLACEPVVSKHEEEICIDFEQPVIENFQNNQVYAAKGLVFNNRYTLSEYEWEGKTYTSETWYGFSLSAMCDTVTEGFGNQYSCSAGKAAGGKQFGLFYYSAYDSDSSCFVQFEEEKEYVIKGMQITNSTYAYLSMKNGDDFAKKFEADDYLRIIFKSYDAEGKYLAQKTFYLADFRENKKNLLNSWEFVDLRELGKLNKLSIFFESSDTGMYGINTPTYVCVDNLIYIKVQE
ncbi:MAG: DUF4465 domain-containing protein [Bacteroidales bacterium]|nr:DUF4465 domain-containing protein [Bacteroidales bacterium]